MKEKHKRRKLLAAVLSAFTLAIIAAVLLAASVNNSTIIHRMFDDLSRFNMLDTYRTEAENPIDEKLNGLEPINSMTASITYEGKNYRVYAHEFKDAEDAFEYFKSCTGQKNAVHELCFYFHKTTAIGSCYVAYYENLAYRVEGKGISDFADFVNWLCKDFPIDIEEAYYDEYGIRLG